MIHESCKRAVVEMLNRLADAPLVDSRGVCTAADAVAAMPVEESMQDKIERLESDGMVFLKDEAGNVVGTPEWFDARHAEREKTYGPIFDQFAKAAGDEERRLVLFLMERAALYIDPIGRNAAERQRLEKAGKQSASPEKVSGTERGAEMADGRGVVEFEGGSTRAFEAGRYVLNVYWDERIESLRIKVVERKSARPLASLYWNGEQDWNFYTAECDCNVNAFGVSFSASRKP